MKRHVMSINEEHPGADLYLVAYLDEEEPVEDSPLYGEVANVPYVAVHVVPAGEQATGYMVIQHEMFELAGMPFEWKHVTQYPSAGSVKMLVSKKDDSTTQSARRGRSQKKNPFGLFFFSADRKDLDSRLAYDVFSRVSQ